MVKDDLYTTVPSFFRCPISLDVMKSPVSLCTGVTYDRASIQRWLDSGNNTCPATMQVLQSKDLIPNHTLERLIQIWSDSVKTRSPNSSNSVTREQARELAQYIVKRNAGKHQNDDDDDKYLEKICKLNLFAKQTDENCEFLLSVEEEQLLSHLVTIVGKHIKNADHACKTVQLCVMLLQHVKHRDKSSVHVFQPIISKIDLGNEFVSSMGAYMLQQASMELKTEVAKLIELIVSLGFKDSFKLAQNVEIYTELLRLVGCNDATAMEASLSCLVCLATPRRNRAMLAKANAVKVLSKALLSEKELSVSITEKVLKLLEMASSYKEGRLQICEDVNCVQAIVKKVLKVSNVATEHAVMILWSLCCLFRDEKAQQAVAKSNGMAKILLLMQSNCTPAVRQMCSDLLKVFRVCSMDNYSCLSSYHTKTTHIMPF